jgi:hypothetical protein
LGVPPLKKIAISLILGLVWIVAAFGQTERPPKKGPSQERMDFFNKNIKLDSIPRGAIELELLRTIPLENEVDEKEIYFRNFVNFSVDDREHVYIPDAALCVIYEFDAQGKLVRKYGKKGQGPGELIFPQFIYFYEDKVIVDDNYSWNWKYFDRKWNFLKQFSPPPRLGMKKLWRGKIIGGLQAGKFFLSVMDMEGKVLSSFGELPYPNQKGNTLNSFVLSISPSGAVWVGFPALGILRKYSMRGLLEKEINILDYSSKLVKGLIKETENIINSGINGHVPIIGSLAFLGDDLIVSGGGLVRPIFQFDPNGAFKKTFYIPPQPGVESLDCQHARFDENGGEVFYMKTETEDEKRVEVYIRKK